MEVSISPISLAKPDTRRSDLKRIAFKSTGNIRIVLIDGNVLLSSSHLEEKSQPDSAAAEILQKKVF